MYVVAVFFFLMIRRPPRSTLDRSSAASDVYKRQVEEVHQLLDRRPVLLLIDRADAGRVTQLDVVVEARPFIAAGDDAVAGQIGCLLYTSPSPRDRTRSRMPSSA